MFVESASSWTALPTRLPALVPSVDVVFVSTWWLCRQPVTLLSCFQRQLTVNKMMAFINSRSVAKTCLITVKNSMLRNTSAQSKEELPERNKPPRNQVNLMIRNDGVSLKLVPLSPRTSSSSDVPTDSEAVPPLKRTRRTKKKRVTTPKPKKPKIRAYIRRRTEIEELRDEMKRLKKEMIQYEHRNEALKQREALAEQDMMNQMMRDALHAQRLSFASTASMLIQFYRDNVTEPFDLPARLGRDPVERQAALLRMKKDRLQVAHHFMRQREYYRATSEFCDRKRFEATNGDFVSLRFEIVPLSRARSVKSIVDALQYFVYNLEMSVSEAIGDITIRDNDDAITGSPVAQHRLVVTVAGQVQTDTNTVAFAEYRLAGSGEHEMV